MRQASPSEFWMFAVLGGILVAGALMYPYCDRPKRLRDVGPGLGINGDGALFQPFLGRPRPRFTSGRPSASESLCTNSSSPHGKPDFVLFRRS